MVLFDWNHATLGLIRGIKLGVDAKLRMTGEGFRRPWPPLIRMDAAVKAK